MCSDVQNDTMIQIIEQVTGLVLDPEENDQYIHSDDALAPHFM
jgi:hypothetical protein